jgi:hypothetical protein
MFVVRGVGALKSAIAFSHGTSRQPHVEPDCTVPVLAEPPVVHTWDTLRSGLAGAVCPHDSDGFSRGVCLAVAIEPPTTAGVESHAFQGAGLLALGPASTRHTSRLPKPVGTRSQRRHSFPSGPRTLHQSKPERPRSDSRVRTPSGQECPRSNEMANWFGKT